MDAETRKLWEYLTQLRTLESALYTQNMAGKQLVSFYSRLGRPAQIRMPEKQEATDFINMGKFFRVPFFICGILAAIPLYHYFMGKASRGLYIISYPWAVIKALFWASLIGAAAGGICVLIRTLIGARDAAGNNRKARDEMQSSLRQDRERVEREKKFQPVLMEQIKLLQKQSEKVKETLARLYSCNIIHPKYRNLIAVTMFCEYLETGRCSALTGHEGAYNIYEQEVRMNRIITQLDAAANMLGEIKKSQNLLFREISEANSTLKQIENDNQKLLASMNAMNASMDSIAENMELTAYNTKVNSLISAATAININAIAGRV